MMLHKIVQGLDDFTGKESALKSPEDFSLSSKIVICRKLY